MTKTPEDVEKPIETVPEEKPIEKDLAVEVEVVEDKKEDKHERPRGRGKQKFDRNKREKPAFDKEAWKPKTELGKKVKTGEIKDLNELFNEGKKILESEIIDVLMPDMETELLLIGQSKGKFGGGARRVFRQTQKKTKEGNKPKFATRAVVGNKQGFVGIGYGKSKETVPAREKSLKSAKLNLIKLARGCGSWECGCGHAHSIPYAVQGKSGSIRITLIPAPKGTGLCAPAECAKVLKLGGITDIWSKTKGQTKNRLVLLDALMDALKNLLATKVQETHKQKLGIQEGMVKNE